MKNKFLLIILLIFIAISFLTLARNPLLNDDASTYALFTKNAILHNQWMAQFVTPGDLSSFLDKPPMGIWMLAWLPKIVGINELTVHIPNLIYYCLLLGLLYFSLAHFASKRIALYSTLIASTSLALVVYSRTPKLDIPLTLLTTAAHFLIYAYLKKEKTFYLYLFTLALAFGFLIKSGFGILIPGLTILGLFIFNSEVRAKLIKPLFSLSSAFCFLIFALIVGGILSLQAIPLKEQWLPYLKSITIQSKYNISYLGFGFHFSIIGILLITIFPWMPLFLTSLKIRLRNKPFNLHTFALFWFWSNFLFLFFFFNQTDFRTFTVFVPPLAILAGFKLQALHFYKKTRLPLILWNIFYLIIFGSALVVFTLNPYNAEGFNVSSALIPIALFTLSLFLLTLFFWRPNQIKLSASLFLICVSYTVLFYNTLPLANAFNPDIDWPNQIKEYQQKGFAFYIYRPPDRKLFMSPDLFYVDFLAGPANQYFWESDKLKQSLLKDKAIILSDTESWKKLNQKGKIIAQDSYSSLILR